MNNACKNLWGNVRGLPNTLKDSARLSINIYSSKITIIVICFKQVYLFNPIIPLPVNIMSYSIFLFSFLSRKAKISINPGNSIERKPKPLMNLKSGWDYVEKYNF
jgi:hypothetical protein